MEFLINDFESDSNNSNFFQYLVISIVLGIIGVGGLVFQWAQSFIDQWLKDITDLQSRVASLETTVASLGNVTRLSTIV